MLILGVEVGPASVHEGLIVYHDGEDLFVPLLELCEVLGIPVKGSVESGLAEGWFRSPSQGFLLSYERRLLRVDGLERQADWALIEMHDTDVYIPLDLFASWFGLTIEPQLRASRLFLPTGQGLPAELLRERARRWQAFESTRPRPDEGLPLEPYRSAWLGWPSFDATLGASVGAGPRQLRTNVLAEGEWLRQEARLSMNVASIDGGVTDGDVRFALGRTTAVDDALLWSAGDVFLEPLPGVSASMDGVGFVLGTTTELPTGDALSTSLRGEEPSGWDVELYRNDELLRFLRVGQDNTYRFDDVPVWPGLNVFRIVSYGPDGQVRESLRRVVVGEGALAADARHWRVYGLWPRRRVFDLRDAGTGGNPPPPLFGVSFARALGRQSSLSFDLLAADVRDDFHAVASLRLRGGVGPLALEVQALGDHAGGHAARGSLQFVHERHDLGLQVERAQQLWAPERDSRYGGEVIDARARLRWAGRMRPRMPVSVEYLEERFAPDANGLARERSTARAGIAQNWRDAGVSLQYELIDEPLSARSGRVGGLMTYRRGSVDVAGQWGVDVSPQYLFRSMQMSAAWNAGNLYRWRIAYDRQRVPGARMASWRDRVEAGMSRRGGRWLLSLKAVYDAERGMGLSVSASTSLQRGHAGWMLDARPSTSTAAVEALVFIDTDADGIRDPGEPALEGVGVSAGFGSTAAATDASGQVRIDRLPARQTVDVRLRTATLGDPFRIPVVTARRLKLPPGATARVEFPVQVSSEIDGMVLLESNGRRRSVSNVELQAVAADGRVFSARSAFDGAYLFDRLPPGRYSLGVASEQLQRLGLCAPPSRMLTLDDPEGGVTTVDWVLVSRADHAENCEPCGACP